MTSHTPVPTPPAIEGGSIPSSQPVRRLPLNAFLLRPDITPSVAFNPPARNEVTWHLWNEDHLEPLGSDPATVAAALDGDVVVALTDRVSEPPPWQAFVREGLGVPGFGASARAMGAAIFLAVEEERDRRLRWVCYSFGYASHAIRRQAVDPRFGLLVALNRIALSQAAEIDGSTGLLRQAAYRARGPYPYQAGYRAATNTPLDTFRIDRLADLLSAAGGQIGSATDPDQVFGSRSLKTHDSVGSVDDLRRLARRALIDYHATDYRSEFAFVDHMVPVYDEGLVEVLRHLVYEAILANDNSVDVLMPDDMVPYDDDRAICFVVRPGQREAAASDRVVTVEMIAMLIRDRGPNGLDQVLRFADANHTSVARATILDCLCAELVHSGQSYILMDGDFYVVSSTLLQRLATALGRIAAIDLDVPCYAGGPEADWTKSVIVAQPTRFVLLDRRLIRLPGETPFEACDLLDLRGRLVHVKRKARSASMSHLFIQAERSTRLLLEAAEARDRLAEIVAAAEPADPDAATALLDGLPSRDDAPRVVLALLGDWRDPGLLGLPLLARMSLVESVVAMTRLGVEVEVALIPLCSRAG